MSVADLVGKVRPVLSGTGPENVDRLGGLPHDNCHPLGLQDKAIAVYEG